MSGPTMPGLELSISALAFAEEFCNPSLLRLDIPPEDAISGLALLLGMVFMRSKLGNRAIGQPRENIRRLLKSFSSIGERIIPSQKQKRKRVALISLDPDDIPRPLQYDFYFPSGGGADFAHSEIFRLPDVKDVISVLEHIHFYAERWLLDQVGAAASPPIYDSSRKRSYEKGWEEQLSGDDSSRKTSYENRFEGRIFGDVRILQAKDDAGIDVTPSFAPDKIIGSGPGSSFCIILAPGVQVYGGVFDVSNGSIFIGANTKIEPNTTIMGPTILGADCVIRAGAYIRGDAVIGNGVYIRCECKNVVIMDKAEFCHPGYVGDSICGYKSHFGNQATAANLPLLPASTLSVTIDDVEYDTGRRKLGLIIGDHSQLGCNSVTDPGTLVAPRTHIYPLTRLPKGLYGPDEIIKNKPMEKGVLERCKLRQAS